MKLVRFIIMILGICMILTNAYAGEESEWVDRILNSDDSVRITKEINEQHIKEADYFIQQGSVNPVVWYLRGGFGSGQLGFYYDDLQNAGKLYLYRLNSPKVQALIKEYQSYYQKAMELDDNPDAPGHLTGMMVSNIGTDTVGDPATKVKAMEKLAALARASEDGSDNPTMVEWNTYAARLGIYMDTKDYESYLKIVNEMIERFGSTEELEGYKRHVEAVIEQQAKTAATHDVYAQADAYTQPKAVAVQKPVKAVEPKKVEESKATNEEPASDNNTMLWWLLGGGALLFGLIVLLRRKLS